MANYVHYRTDTFNKEAYEGMLRGQVQEMQVMTQS